MKKILFLGDSNETFELLQQAKKEGLYTIVTDYCSPSRSKAKLYADEYWMISTGDLDLLEQKCTKHEISTVISGASDYNIEMSIRLCDRLNLPSICSLNVWKTIKNKSKFKVICKESGVPVPKDYVISKDLQDDELKNIAFPVVVKPIDRESNIGITFCYDFEQLVNGIHYAREVSTYNEIIVEEMIKGVEFFSYYLLANGEAFFLTLGIRLSQCGEPAYCYSLNTSICSFTDDYLLTMNVQVIKMLKNIGCMEGLVCVQCMRDEKGNFYAFEMCYSAEGSVLISPLSRVCNFNVIQWQLECAMGVQHTKDDIPDVKKVWKRCANSYILFSNKSGTISEVNGIDIVKKLPNVTIRMNRFVGDYVHAYSPMGNIMFDTDDCEQLCDLIQYINNYVSIINEKKENVLIYFSDFDKLRKEYWDMKYKHIYF